MKKKQSSMNPMKPSAKILVELGSAIVHAEEFMSPRGHPFDKMAFEHCLGDSEVRAWLRAMDDLALLPTKRG